MNSRTKTIRVLPNKYSALDDQGNPCGIVPVDPIHNPRREFVGAKLASAEILDRYEAGDLRQPRQYNTWEFSDKPVDVPLTEYYKEKVRNGELFAADKASAKHCGVAWYDPDELLAASMIKAAKEWKSAYGEYPETLEVDFDTQEPGESNDELVARVSGEYVIDNKLCETWNCAIIGFTVVFTRKKLAEVIYVLSEDKYFSAEQAKELTEGARKDQREAAEAEFQEDFSVVRAAIREAAVKGYGCCQAIGKGNRNRNRLIEELRRLGFKFDDVGNNVYWTDDYKRLYVVNTLAIFVPSTIDSVGVRVIPSYSVSCLTSPSLASQATIKRPGLSGK